MIFSYLIMRMNLKSICIQAIHIIHMKQKHYNMKNIVDYYYIYAILYVVHRLYIVYRQYTGGT